VPDDPEAWLLRVARNLAVDGLRRRAVGERATLQLAAWERAREGDAGDGPGATEPETDDGALDDTLRMMFLCAHPALQEDARVPLVLKTVCGFGNAEIAAALLAKEGTIAQRLTRAKARLEREGARFEMPRGAELDTRLADVLQVLHLLFNEGYRAHRGEELVRLDLVHEAVRLATLLTDDPSTDRPEVHALLALMLLTGARLPARSDEAGELLTLAEQDRSRWDRRWIASGMRHFQRSIAGDEPTAYHAEAAIASFHATARDYAATDWRAIRAEYERLLALRDDPVVRLNRAVAIAKVDGPRAGLAALDELEEDGPLRGYFLRLATRAQLEWDLGQHARAASALEAALALPCSEPERRLLERRLEAVRRGEAARAW
jgi:RNA polymerase sigma-70 factor (ECF subfamily)